MLVSFHIFIALASLVLAGLAYIKPSRKILSLSGLLIVSTLASGTYLVINRHAHLLGACLSGIIYLFFVSVELFFARRRLVKVLADMGH